MLPVSHPAIDAPRPQAQLPGCAARWRRWFIDCGSVVANRLFHAPSRDSFGILMYHRVTEPIAGWPKPTWNVPPRLFEQQISGLLKRGFEAWPLKKVIACRAGGEPILRNVFVITFDDGYDNFFTQVLPILQRLNVPATLFLATAFLDDTNPFPYDDWAAAGREEVPRDSWLPLTTEHCRALAASGLVELAAHTHSHQDFRRRPDDFEADLRQNVAELRERFGVRQPSFAFPFGTPELGFVTTELIERARWAGVQSALSTERKSVLPHEDPFQWGRFPADDQDTAATLAARLNGWNNFFRDWSCGLRSLARSARGRWGK